MKRRIRVWLEEQVWLISAGNALAVMKAWPKVIVFDQVYIQTEYEQAPVISRYVRHHYPDKGQISTKGHRTKFASAHFQWSISSNRSKHTSREAACSNSLGLVLFVCGYGRVGERLLPLIHQGVGGALDVAGGQAVDHTGQNLA